jgi:hypothetical protein
MIPSFPKAKEHPCAASDLATNASCRFGEMKSKRDDGYVTLIPTGHRISVCGLWFSK